MASPWPALMGRVFTQADLGPQNPDNRTCGLARRPDPLLLAALATWHAVTEAVRYVYYAFAA
ncbi:MAG TPA: hypothetical protein VEV63_05205 [Streptosporangiaceae bacterium]|nr:hypothetical protein [Streptosporangiaceae bacterium]